MMRRLATLILTLPLVLAGGQAAHWLGYVLAVPSASTRETLLMTTGHASQTILPVGLGALGGMVAVLLAALATRRPIGPSAFVALPAAGFVVQEHLERLSIGAAPWHVWQEPTFWRGLLLQVPFGLLAFLLASIMLGAARVVHRVIARRHRRPVRIAGSSPRPDGPRSIVSLPRLVRGGDALSFRGPPLAVRGCP